ncbi:MAG: type II secretion system minor pseudopilin GspK, partial [Magnetococcales bacterium]|nr:type II secretion system minor pseudopilin GspK [Magnetococcales bacterium]
MASRGAALLTALLIVSVCASVAVGLITGQHLAIRRTANILDRDRSLQIALGGEAWAMGILSRDAKEGNRDHLNEIWASAPPPIPVTGGMASGKITDMQGRFNLNNLLLSGKQSPVDLARFERLLKIVELDPRLAVAVVDWMDPDSLVGNNGGAENPTYLGKSPPYRAANQFFMTVSELRLVEGFDAKAVARLIPLVAALPERTDLNINTAPLELLMTLTERMTREEAMTLDEKRRVIDGFVDVAAFLAEPIFKGKEVLSSGLSVSSRFFLVDGQVQMGRGRMRLFSLLSRNSSNLTVVRRSQAGL